MFFRLNENGQRVVGMSKPFADALIEEIRSKNDIVALISDDMVLRKAGRNYVGLCPFHGEKTPSFTVSPEKQIFYCFGCGAGGDCFSYIMKRQNLNFADAIKALATRAGITLPDEIQSPRERQEYREKEMVYEVNRLAADYFRNQFLNHPAGKIAQKYLSDRGIRPEIMEQFYLGVSLSDWDSLLKTMVRKGISAEALETAGLVVSRQDTSGHYDRFRNRLMFPIYDSANRVTGFGGRVLDDTQPKYLNSPETPVFDKSRNVYGIHLSRHAMRNQDQVILVEGYMDVIGLFQSGVQNVAATLGTALAESHGRILSHYGSDIVIAYDGDRAGQAAAMRGAAILQKAGCLVRIARIPGEEDPDSYVRKEGKDAFLHLVENALSLTAYQLQEITITGKKSTSDGVTDMLRKAIPIIGDVSSVSEREVFIRNFARSLGVREDALRADVQRYLRKGNKSMNNPEAAQSPPVPRQTLQPAHRTAEAMLLQLIPLDPEAWWEVRQKMNPDDFIDPAWAVVARACWEMDQQGLHLTVANLLDYMQRNYPEHYGDAARLFIETEDVPRTTAAIDDYIESIKGHKRKLVKRALQDEIHLAEQAGDKTKVEELLAKYRDLLEQDGQR